MVEVIVFPDVEDLLVTYLGAELTARGDTATVHTRVPAPRPDRFVLVPRVGGTRRSLVVDSPTIGFECWAATDTAAEGLCSLVRGLVFALPRQPPVRGVQFYRVDEFGGPTNLPDPVSNQSRYVFTAAVSCRGTAL